MLLAFDLCAAACPARRAEISALRGAAARAVERAARAGADGPDRTLVLTAAHRALERLVGAPLLGRVATLVERASARDAADRVVSAQAIIDRCAALRPGAAAEIEAIRRRTRARAAAGSPRDAWARVMLRDLRRAMGGQALVFAVCDALHAAPVVGGGAEPREPGTPWRARDA